MYHLIEVSFENGNLSIGKVSGLDAIYSSGLGAVFEEMVKNSLDVLKIGNTVYVIFDDDGNGKENYSSVSD